MRTAAMANNHRQSALIEGSVPPTHTPGDDIPAGEWTDVHTVFLQETGRIEVPDFTPPAAMFDPSTLYSTLPSWSVVSPRSMPSPHSARDLRSSGRSFKPIPPRMTNTSASHSGRAGLLTSLHWTRAGSPALPVLQGARSPAAATNVAQRQPPVREPCVNFQCCGVCFCLRLLQTTRFGST